MKVTICSSIQLVEDIKKISEELKSKGFDVEIPLTANRILNGELTLEKFQAESNFAHERKIKDSVFKKHFEKIKNSDCVLVLNYEKKGVAGYIGGNTF